MITKENWKELSKRTGIEVDKLQGAIASEKEETIELSTVNFLSDSELTDLKERVGKESAKTGAKTIVEMDVKALREKYKLEFTGKTIENFADAFAEKQVADAKIAPDKKVADAQKSVKELQGTYETDIALKDKEIQSLTKQVGEFQINGDLAKHLPDELIGIKNNQFSTLAKTEYDFIYEDGALVVKQNGTVLKDKLQKAIPVKDVLTDYAKQNGWVENAGRKGKDELGGKDSKFKNMNDVMKHMDENKIDPLGLEGQKLVADFNNLNK